MDTLRIVDVALRVTEIELDVTGLRSRRRGDRAAAPPKIVTMNTDMGLTAEHGIAAERGSTAAI